MPEDLQVQFHLLYAGMTAVLTASQYAIALWASKTLFLLAYYNLSFGFYET